MIVNKYNQGGGVTPQEVQAQIDSALTPYWDSAATESAITEAISGISLDGYYTSAQTDEKIASAVTPVANHLEEVEQVTASALTELHVGLLEVSGRTVDLSGYYTSAQTEDAISAATSGKADAASVSANTGDWRIPYWNEQGIITGDSGNWTNSYIYTNEGNTTKFLANVNRNIFIYTPTRRGNVGEFLVGDGTNVPKWSAMPAADVTKAYVDSADTALQDQIDTMDEVVSAALVDLEGKKVESQDVKHMVKLTQAQYDALVNKDPYTFYIIVSN